MVTEAVALAVGGAFLSSFLNVLFDRLATVQALKPVINLFRGSSSRDDLLQKMEILLLRVEKVLGDAEKQIMNPSVKKWVDKLTDAAYDAEDLLDAMAIEGPFQETQLRYLDLSGYALPCLPERVGCLLNLETLKLSGCPRLTLLPANLWNLTKLEHLDISGTPILKLLNSISNLKELGHLDLSGTKIQHLPEGDKKYLRELILEWDVDPRKSNAQNAAYDPHNGNIEKAAGDRLNGNAQNAADDPHNSNGQNAVDDPHNGHAENAVEPLNGRAQNAAGYPCNGNVNNAVNDPQNGDAEIAAGSPHINGNTQNAVGDSQNRSGQSAVDDHQNPSAKHAVNVLDKLKPGENLERLKIKDFFGMSLPRWLGNASFSKMKSITLENCQNCNSLPPLGQLPSLKELAIHDMAGVKIVGPEFYGGGVIAFKSLEKLWFENMENWEQWLPFCNEPRFPSLHTLILFRCRKLTGDLPTQHLTLEEHIQECDNLKRCQGPTNE
ncbi:hypothetical protein POUND7_008599 [Theobroma cacao]